MKLQGRKIYPGIVRGEALVSTQAISFYGGVDPESGVVVERGHELEGWSIAGKVLVFPTGKGSTVGSYTLYRLKAEEKAPLAIVNAECETITAVGCIIAEIPCVDRVDLTALQTGQLVAVDGEAGEVRILEPANQPPPLCGSEKGTFTEETMRRRLPGLVDRALAEDGWSAESQRRLEALSEEMPDGLIRPILDRGAPDEALWNDWMQPHIGKSWLDAPWFPAETYFFRRILEASGYFQPGPDGGRDPFRSQKREGLTGCGGGLNRSVRGCRRPLREIPARRSPNCCIP